PTGATEEAVVYALEDPVRWRLPWRVEEGDARDLKRGKYVMLDESARKRFGAYAVGDYREFYGQRVKVLGRTRGALSFTTMPIAFMDYRVAQSMARQELHNRSTYTEQKSYLRSARYGAAQIVRIFSGSRQTALQASVAASRSAS